MRVIVLYLTFLFVISLPILFVTADKMHFSVLKWLHDYYTPTNYFFAYLAVTIASLVMILKPLMKLYFRGK